MAARKEHDGQWKMQKELFREDEELMMMNGMVSWGVFDVLIYFLLPNAWTIHSQV